MIGNSYLLESNEDEKINHFVLRKLLTTVHKVFKKINFTSETKITCHSSMIASMVVEMFNIVDSSVITGPSGMVVDKTAWSTITNINNSRR